MSTTISLRAARATKYVEDLKESLAALKSIRTREIEQFSREMDLLNAYEMLSKYQKGKLYRSIDTRLKWLKGLNRKICFIETYLPRVMLLLESLQQSEAETIKRSLG